VPVFGSIMAILLLGEQPRLFHLVGYVMVFAGVVIASRKTAGRTFRLREGSHCQLIDRGVRSG
jgi:drug/metabolite transporter (DMT)-like permease